MYRRADPTFTNWEPKTAYEAVDRFTRCQRNGLKAVMIPECLIKCSRRLPEPELDKFEEWIINPGGLDYSKAVPDDSIRAQCAATFQAAVGNHNRVPPLPPVDADEKFEMDIEKMDVQALGNGDVIFSNVSSKFAAMAVCGMDPLSGLVPPT